MSQEIGVYVSVLQDSIKDKQKLLERIYELTKEQEKLLSSVDFDMDAFEGLLDSKGNLIGQVTKLDEGFEGVYQNIKEELMREKEKFKLQILGMQDMLRTVTDLGIKIQALEKRNHDAFQRQTAKKKMEIRNFQVNSRTASSYSQHMANQHQEGQSYFLDKKK